MSNRSSNIGLFDSGVGGLTVASAIRNILPGENMIYFGDTAHLPYGDKSRESIIDYSIRIADFLLSKDSKIILIACNSASSNAYKEVKAHVGARAIVMNVIQPVVDFTVYNENSSNIGVIGTKATINSQTYQDEIISRDPTKKVSSLATPLFVPMIEEGFIFDDISNAIIRSYLSKKELEGIDTLILGCTHYPIIKNQISRFFNFNVHVIDTAKIVAENLRDTLKKNDLLNNNNNNGKDQFYVSDHTEYFSVIAKMFFGADIQMAKKNIWS